jgi:hypothetical protein
MIVLVAQDALVALVVELQECLVEQEYQAQQDAQEEEEPLVVV